MKISLQVMCMKNSLHFSWTIVASIVMTSSMHFDQIGLIHGNGIILKHKDQFVH
ncbi:hypothetical protein AHAS_Ahas20G0233400 [Arachis hypogaea]